MKRSVAFLFSVFSMLAQDWRYDLIGPIGAAPPPRIDGAIAYDTNTASLYLFGGQAEATVNDLWSFSVASKSWKRIDPSGPLPPARLGHTLIADQKRSRMILFGGQASGFFSDVWAYDIKANRWSQLAANDAGPSTRYGHSAVIDADTNRMIISHGFTNSGRFDDTWAFDLSTNQWRNLTPSGTKPLRRCLHHAVLDPATRQMFLYGGCASGFGPCPLGDLWAFNLQSNTWNEITGSSKPAPRQHYGISFDTRRGRLIVFGGSGAGILGDTWFYDPNARVWNQLSAPIAAPAARLRHQGAYSPERGETYFFGGDTGAASSNELWVLSSGLAALPRLAEGGAVNAFSGIGGSVARGEYVSLYGDSLGSDPSPQLSINGRLVPAIFAGLTQINFQVPEDLAESSEVAIQVSRNGATSNELRLPLAAAHPGVFPIAVNQDGSLNAPSNAALPGSIVVFYSTGQGVNANLPVQLEIAGIRSELLYAAASPGAAGLLQINARVPTSVSPGAVPVLLKIGAFESQAGVVLYLR